MISSALAYHQSVGTPVPIVFDWVSYAILVGLLAFVLVIWKIDQRRNHAGQISSRRVTKEIWGAMRARYFANKSAGSRPKDGL